jgi:hypothetical protein
MSWQTDLLQFHWRALALRACGVAVWPILLWSVGSLAFLEAQ